MTTIKLKSDEETSDETMLQMDVEQIAVPTLLTESEAQYEDEEPMAKRQRTEEAETITMDDSVKTILFNINKAISFRLDSVERKLTNLHNTCYKMGRKMDNLNLSVIRALSRIKELEKTTENGCASPNNTVVIGFPPEDHDQSPSNPQSPISQSISRNVTLITLNTEDDFPNGSWLGDETNMECRVRCGISQSDMLHVMQTAKTPEKCALKLLDYLFDRETQASSNLSGTGKHGKKQLNPLMIYGLRCHLIKHFDITDCEWHRIRMNIDSKCRTAFRRKQRGLPMTVKAFGYKTGNSDADQFLNERFGERVDHTTDSRSSEEEVQGVHIQLPADSNISDIAHEVEHHHHQQDSNTVIKKVRIEQDGVPLHEGQINITQSGEIQIAVMEELEGATTLVLQQQRGDS
ncbi:protein BANP-like [Asterias rubens]|uniref:protein BANP-like n=1 Tax=Asterias rubens TaxID=7604 RepID=UPI001455AC60|nr:protein BANP-like [Asterias rubens]